MASTSATNDKSQADDAPEKKTCVPCSSLDTSALLSSEDVDKRLQGTPALAVWKHDDATSSGSIPKLSWSFTAKNFQAAMDALNAAGAIAERENHHPDFHLTNYRNVQIDIYTHKIGGITENDIVLAQLLSEQVQVVYSPKWLKEHPEAIVSSGSTTSS